jgi:hypothetical protein
VHSETPRDAVHLPNPLLPGFNPDPGEAAVKLHADLFRPQSGQQPRPWSELTEIDTSISDYVWLPFRFDGERALLDWQDKWRIEDFA